MVLKNLLLSSTSVVGITFFGLPSLAANVIVNGTFNNTTTGWTGTYSLRSTAPTITTGTYFFAGANASNTISQTYNLSASELTTLAGIGLDFEMSGDLFGFTTQNDFSTFTAIFFDGAGGTGNQLASVSLTSQDGDPGTWPSSLIAGSSPSFQSTTGSVNSSTRSIRFVLTSTRTEGTNNDGYADNLFFSLNPANPTTPEPNSLLALFGIGLSVLVSRKKES